jgi:hypothetical protein
VLLVSFLPIKRDFIIFDWTAFCPSVASSGGVAFKMVHPAVSKLAVGI